MSEDNPNPRDSNATQTDPPVPPQAPGVQEPDEVRSQQNAQGQPTSSDSAGGSAGTQRETVPVESTDRPWTDFFRYEEAYREQADAIENFIESLADHGYTVLEGACGTGKTLASLTGAITAVRKRDSLVTEFGSKGETDTYPDYSQILAVTPVKQQIQIFIDEMRGINQQLPNAESPLDTVVLRGKVDLVPYRVADHELTDDLSQDDIDDFRDQTRDVIKFDSDIPLDWPTEMTPPEHAKHDYNWDDPSEEAEEARDTHRYCPERAAAVAKLMTADTASSSDLGTVGDTTESTWTIRDIETPYPERIPTVSEVADLDEYTGAIPDSHNGRFDPFYAATFADDSLPFWFNDAPNRVFDRDALLEEALSAGVCPHESMAHLAQHCDVAVGNYMHAFDPQTRLLTVEKCNLVSPNTITIVDEGHRVEPEVRDMLSSSIDPYTLRRAANDCRVVTQIARERPDKLDNVASIDVEDLELTQARRTVENALTEVGDRVGGDPTEVLRAIERTAELFEEIRTELFRLGSEAVEEREKYSSTSWKKAYDRGWSIEDVDYGLAPPDSRDRDKLTKSLTRGNSGFSESDLTAAAGSYDAVGHALSLLDEQGILSRRPADGAPGEFCSNWLTYDRVQYHRELVLEESFKDDITADMPDWCRAWTPKFQNYNTIPRLPLQEVFGGFGGGMLMSATIRPADVYMQAIGIDDVPYPPEDDIQAVPGAWSTGDEERLAEGVRPVTTLEYPIQFPEENRLSLIADLPEYTSDNRGRPADSRHSLSNVRQQHEDIVASVAGIDGNVLVVMPSYAEARWIKKRLETRPEDIGELYLDRSSSNDETDKLLSDFFEADNAVVCTSARGTITEGVDYDGDKLHACVAVGVPFVPPTDRMNAVRHAYDEEISSYSGFEAAMTIPAVRKVRQAVGRVIRGTNETGIRILADERYGNTGFKGVNGLLSPQEQSEYQVAPADAVQQAVNRFEQSKLHGDSA